jgi:hypothetical protein
MFRINESIDMESKLVVAKGIKEGGNGEGFSWVMKMIWN